MSLLPAIAAVVGKELLVEWRHRARFSALFFFAFAVLLMVAFAMPNTQLLHDIAGGALWIGLLLASTRSLDQSMYTETENNSLEGLTLWPVPAAAIFYGKALANTIVLIAVATTITPLCIVLYDPPLRGTLPEYVAVLLLGCAGLAAPGTFVSTLTVRARGSSALMPLLLFPLVVPVVMAASKATTLLFEGDPMEQVDDLMAILIVFNLVHWSLEGAFYALIIDEG
jgi:heme exporter protein B